MLIKNYKKKEFVITRDNMINVRIHISLCSSAIFGLQIWRAIVARLLMALPPPTYPTQTTTATETQMTFADIAFHKEKLQFFQSRMSDEIV